MPNKKKPAPLRFEELSLRGKLLYVLLQDFRNLSLAIRAMNRIVAVTPMFR